MLDTTALNVQELAEGSDLEVKRATGRDGSGELPASFFESYSAMANTYGGVILLGVEEKPRGTYRIVGLTDTARVRKALWDGLNNRQRVSANLLSDRMVDVVLVDEKQLIRVHVPRARRAQRPVFVGPNPLTGTYRRNYEGDYLCDEETVRRMMAEQVEDERDARLLESYGFEDLDLATLRAYRNQFRATRPDHPWLDLGDREFLRCIGGWTRDRVSGSEGLTLAGLLMFGRLRSILDAVPHYVVDYQERPEPHGDGRWIDRVTTDGTWSGNLYDFYRRVISKLTTDLKVPFVLRGTGRVDETSVHEALREALSNTLLHADYTGRMSILVVKRPDLFGFRNPGTMRLPLEDALSGGMSDCRNRNLQKMFQLAGLGEQAGSGIPKIYRNWKGQHWRAPDLTERIEPDQTILTMRMVSLLPPSTLSELDERYGSAFRELSEVQRLALVTVAIEGKVTHTRLKSMTVTHPRDTTTALSALVRDGFLESAGAARGTYYFFPGEAPTLDEGLVLPGFDRARAILGTDTAHPAGSRERPQTEPGAPERSNSERLQPDSERLQPDSEHLLASSEHSRQLLELASPVREVGRVPMRVMRETIVSVCTDRFVSLRTLAHVLRRSPDTLRTHYLNDMVKAGILELRYPDRPNHPGQAYRTRSSG
jgi:ATP-dependent DNA helicase RecG